MLAVFGPLDWTVLAGYFALMFCVGHLTARKKTDAEGYFLAARKMPVIAVALSIVATSLSVATFVGAPQFALDGDLTYLSQNIGVFLAAMIVATLFLPRLYHAGTVTIYGYIDQRFGETARIATSAMFLFGRLLASGVRLFIAAIPVCLLVFGRFTPSKAELIGAIILIGAVGVAYTVAGGIKAVIITDCVQILIVIGSCVLGISLLLHKIPVPLDQIVHVLSDPASGPHGSKLKLFDFSLDPTRTFTVWTALLGATFLNTASLGVDHDLVQRMLTARSAWRGSISLIISQFVGLLVVSLFMAIGLLLYVFYRRPDVMGASAPADPLQSSIQVYPQFLLYHLPTGLAGLAIAGMFAAAQGSLDSAINAMASSAVADLYWPLQARRGRAVDPHKSTRAPRLAVAMMGALLIGFAIVSAMHYDPNGKRPLIDFALGVMSFAYTGMLGVFLTALLTRRGSTASVLAALATGVVVTILLQESVFGAWTQRLLGVRLRLASFWWMPIGTVVSFVVCLAGAARPSRRGFE
ncbi:MAG: sodium:solute symporter family transporter, partial [Tepidisphaeraceae bacterium]